MLRINDLFKRKEPLPIQEIEAEGLSLRIYEKTCCHSGFLVELYARVETDEWVMIGAIGQEDLQRSVMILQAAMAWANDRALMARQLQTIWLNGATYYVDERLGELRKKDDPSNRIPLTV